MAAVLGRSFVVFLLFLSYSLAAKDVFHEELLLRPLKTGHVYAHFQFTTVWDVDIRDKKACKCQNCYSGFEFLKLIKYNYNFLVLLK